MANHFTILAWRIPRAEDPGGLWSVGSQESDRPEVPACTQLLTGESIQDLRDSCHLALFTICLFIYMQQGP